jgi:hypothetical protein
MDELAKVSADAHVRRGVRVDGSIKRKVFRPFIELTIGANRLGQGKLLTKETPTLISTGVTGLFCGLADTGSIVVTMIP